MAVVPRIEVLWWEGCPSTERALAELRDAMSAEGIADADVAMREITSDEQAREVGFRGSPTILIDGSDAVPSEGEPVALACRVYRRRDGRVSPTPDPADVREALRRALAARKGRQASGSSHAREGSRQSQAQEAGQ